MRITYFACLSALVLLWPMALHTQLTSATTDDPQVMGRWQNLPLAQVVAIHMIKVPGTDYWLFMERNSAKQFPTLYRQYVAGLYHETTYQYNIVNVIDMVFCSGHTVTEDGDVVIVGGHNYTLISPPLLSGIQGIRIFRRSQLTNLQPNSSLSIDTVSLYGLQSRWYPSATLLTDGKIYVSGGTYTNNGGRSQANSNLEVLDPKRLWLPPVVQGPLPRAYAISAGSLYYPYNYVLPTGDVASFVGRKGVVINPATGALRNGTAPDMPGYGDILYPLTGTSVMLPLLPEKDYAVEFVFFGGQNAVAFANRTTPYTTVASDEIRRISLTWNNSTLVYRFSNYTFDPPMQQPRVMADSVLLPNGQVIIINGAEIGAAGDAWTAHFPVFAPELYDPATRTTRRLASSLIPRLYHSTAGLTMDGNILVAGNDRSDRYNVREGQPFSPSPHAPAEYRVEVFQTPFFFMDDLKPQFVNNASLTLSFTMLFHVQYTSTIPGGTVNVTAVRLVAPSSTTHSFNFHQRVVGLRIMDRGANNTLTVKTPINMNVAPPGWYMLFLLNGDVYSRAIWVNLKRPAAKEPPSPPSPPPSPMPQPPSAPPPPQPNLSSSGGIPWWMRNHTIQDGVQRQVALSRTKRTCSAYA